MTPKETDRLIQKTIEALNRRDTCPSHQFVVVEKDFPQWFVCSCCGAEIDGFQHYWYIKGIEHGRREQQ